MFEAGDAVDVLPERCHKVLRRDRVKAVLGQIVVLASGAEYDAGTLDEIHDEQENKTSGRRIIRLRR